MKHRMDKQRKTKPFVCWRHVDIKMNSIKHIIRNVDHSLIEIVTVEILVELLTVPAASRLCNDIV